MEAEIRAFADDDLDPIVALSLMAWQPVFESFRKILGAQIYPILYPDWPQSQKEGVEGICLAKEKNHVLVAEANGKVVGFIAYELNTENHTGEVLLLAVHPDYQNNAIGTELNLCALRAMKAAGMKLAVVGTGGDDSHAPARRSYEKAGYMAFPLVRYYKDL